VKKLLDTLFGQKIEKQDLDIPTRPLPQETTQVTLKKGHLEPPQLIVGCAQSVGRQRDHNEDALFTLTTTLTSDYGNVPFGLYIVADGMGGHQHGELASGIAIRVVASLVVRKLYTTLLSLKHSPPEQSLLEIMQEGVMDAHRTITRQVPGGGTTLTSVLILGNQMTVAHVGDSRAYAINQSGSMEVLTRDHSLVKRLVELGRITTDEAAVHPQKNVLYRALGQGEPFDPDLNTMQLPDSGYILICSDGLWGVVADEDIHRLVLEAETPEDACMKLIEAANEAGGPDNITAILVRLPG
jgi:serine/threonine protein phosphatase PrpC